MNKDKYLNNPCKMLSIPYWKAKKMKIPDDVVVIHDSDYQKECFSDYQDEKYFRIIHNLKEISHFVLDGFEITTSRPQDINIFFDIINRSYEDMQVDIEQLINYQNTEVYEPNLWILVKDKLKDKYVGCVIADYDKETREMILEWVQVLPEYRGRKIGQYMVNELLFRMKDKALFATVSGGIDNPSNPLTMYQKCGFTGNDVWHVLRKT